MARGKPRSDLYIPKPTEWRWERLDDFEVRNRLNAARLTEESLAAELKRMKTAREEARAALWARLPEAKLYEQQTALARLEDMGKQMAQLEKTRSQVATAIDYIERHMNGVRTAK